MGDSAGITVSWLQSDPVPAFADVLGREPVCGTFLSVSPAESTSFAFRYINIFLKVMDFRIRSDVHSSGTYCIPLSALAFPSPYT